MRINNASYLSKAIACGVIAMLASSCGVFEGKKKSKSSDPAPVEIETIVSASEKATPTGGASVALKLSSNASDAKFKCLVEPKAAEGQGSNNWVDCKESYEVAAGQQIKLTIKAIGASGAEDKSPIVILVPENGATGAIVDGGNAGIPVATEILGKSEIGAEYGKDLLKLSLAVKGGDPTAYRFECKRENDQQYRLCSRDGSNSYDFGKLVDGQDIRLSVRAVHNISGAIASEDEIAFRVSLTMLEGADILRDSKTGEVAIKVRLDSGESASCEIRKGTTSQGEFDCKDGVKLALSTMPQGSYTLAVTKKSSAGSVIATENIAFCAQVCAGTGAQGRPAVLAPQRFLIGSFYEFVVPPSMHVTEYSTTKTYNCQLSFYRVLSDFDPHYIGNALCNGYGDRIITALTPRGAQLDYCHSTLQDDVYKWLTDYRLANNHIEVGTDADIVEANPMAHERIMINVFDADYEFQRSRSRFEYLCMNRPLIKSPFIKIVNDFWQREELRAEFWMCDVDLPGTGPGFPGIEQWRVGAFFMVDQFSELPNMYCNTCEFSSKKALEVVYMARPNETNWRPENFARSAQMLFLNSIRESQP